MLESFINDRARKRVELSLPRQHLMKRWICVKLHFFFAEGRLGLISQTETSDTDIDINIGIDIDIG